MKKLKTKKDSPTGLITDRPNGKPTHDEIALAAYTIWNRAGRAQGRDVEQWLHAEAQLRQAPQPGAATRSPLHCRCTSNSSSKSSAFEQAENQYS